jgi:tRNA pseudouridine38-40 synthase
MKVALGIEYDGTNFCGWQNQSKGQSVQSHVERALSFVADSNVAVVCAGRTDAGVHARCQVVHFVSATVRTPWAWLMGGNTNLPASIAVRWVQPVAEDFHARFSARARRYRYSLINRRSRPALEKRFCAWECRPLDVAAMQAASRCLLGEHDFTSFRTLACQAPSPVRTILALDFTQRGERIDLNIEANAFLHHMVRNIAGSLLAVGRGEHPPEWIAEVLAARSRKLAGITASASGLCFLGPRYPLAFGLPDEVCLDA